MGPCKAASFALLLFLQRSSSFLLTEQPPFAQQQQRLLQGRSIVLRSASDDDFMASLKSRVQQVSDRETKLPLVVLDSMLPRQVLKITVNNPMFIELVKTRLLSETPWFGMLGMARLPTGEAVHLKSGVQVDIAGKPVITDDGVQIELKGVRRFRITGEVDTVDAGWTEARVEFLNDVDNEEDFFASASSSSAGSDQLQTDRLGLARAMSKARQLAKLVDEWIALARTKERREGQIDQLMADLGAMPPGDEPTNTAFWVGALINPIPAMGVALEIRPALLIATTAEERVDIAVAGIQRSIRHMQGEPLLS